MKKKKVYLQPYKMGCLRLTYQDNYDETFSFHRTAGGNYVSKNAKTSTSDTQKNCVKSNHLGNVLNVVTDRKIAVSDLAVIPKVAYFSADVESYSDYYPFGMLMPGRHGNETSYKYGFNGKEKIDEVSGEGNVYDYGFRIYNPRIGKFLSVDPLTDSYPWYTPYQFAGNKPIWAVDLDGLEEKIYIYLFKGNDKPAQLLETKKNVLEKADGTRINIKTGQSFDESEMGTVQYEYVDASGKGLQIRKEYDGTYSDGSGDIMDAHQKGQFGTIYTGRKNPLQANKKKDYRREPLNNLDYAALKHDKLYDELKEKDPSINFATDKLCLPADKALIQDYKNIVFNKIGETGAKNTVKERIQAGIQIVKMRFYTAPKRFQRDEKVTK